MELNSQLLNDDKSKIIFKAMLVPEILEVIFKNLDTERLKRCRGVCLTWSNEIARLFHTRVIPKVSYGNWSKFQEQLDHGKCLRLLCPFQEMDAVIYFGHRFCQQGLKSPLPLTRLNLYDCADYGIKAGDDPELSKYVLEILQSCSETLTHLQTTFWTLAEETRFQLPQLRTLVAVGYQNRLQLEEQENPSHFSEPELKFFLLVISGAPRLSTLTLSSLSAFPELLRQASLKKIQELEVCGFNFKDSVRDTWGALSQIDAEALKTLRLETLTFSELGNLRERVLVFSRFSNSLESLRFRSTGCRLPVCPRVRTLHFSIKIPMDLSLFPSLKKVVLHDDATFSERSGLNDRIHPCPTVSDVCIDLVVRDGGSSRTLFGKLLRLFPFATFWRVNYRGLEDFCGAAAEFQFPIERLEVNLNCPYSQTCILDRSSVDEAARTDLRIFSNLRLLTNLRELDLRQDLDCSNYTRVHGKTFSDWGRLLPYNVGAIKFTNLCHLRTLRIYASSSELPPDLNTIQDSNYFSVELLLPSLRGPNNWSDSIAHMSNVTILREKRTRSILSD